MGPYYLMLFVIIYFVFFEFLVGEKDSILKIIIILLLLFSGLRGNGNGDYFNYLEFSNYIINLRDLINISFPMEFGFRAISLVKNYFNLHDQFVIYVMNAISLTCIYFFIKNNSEKKIFSIFLFIPIFLQYDMHAARSAVAISIGTIGYKYYKENRTLDYLLVVMISMLFHKSAIILILPLMIKNINIDIFISSIVLVIGYVLGSTNRIYFLVVNILNVFKLNYFSKRLLNYIASAKYGYSMRFYDPRIIIVVGIYIIFKTCIKNNNENQKLLKILFLNAFIMMLFRNNTALALRLSSFFNIYTIIAIPKIIFENKKLGVLIYFGSFILNLIMIIYLINGSVPYKLFFASI